MQYHKNIHRHEVLSKIFGQRFCEPRVRFNKAQAHCAFDVVARWFGNWDILLEVRELEEIPLHLLSHLKKNHADELVEEAVTIWPLYFSARPSLEYFYDQIRKVFGFPEPSDLLDLLVKNVSQRVQYYQFHWNPRENRITLFLKEIPTDGFVFDFRDEADLVALYKLMEEGAEIVTTSIQVVYDGKDPFRVFAVPALPQFAEDSPYNGHEEAFIHRLSCVAAVL